MNQFIKEIVDFTGLKAKRNIILFEVNLVEHRFTSNEASVMIHARMSPDDEWQLTRAMPPKTTKHYLKGFFGFGRVTQNGELVSIPNHVKQKDIDKVRKGKIANAEKREKKKKKVIVGRTETVNKMLGKKSTKAVAYRLGELDGKAIIDKAFKKGVCSSPSKSIQSLILENLTNAACIIVMEKLYEKKIKESDINKQRRVLRRKGEWS